ncbi:hypothetical protein I6E84_06970 [Psychrobacter sp. SCQQ22]|uniref:hypothetical protein n=1 Tax=Psychrobacter sp. SCQQ22 TaxID=2792059 RepID=UPI0018CCD307|nr:hypothetical protein [Psychrobacter sp. SCQQ22]MBH0085958.1 hypothetical protein [Psychrobacter sp. SCQQ22]
MDNLEQLSVGMSFVRMIAKYTRRGWYRVGDRGDKVKCIVFHTHPDDGDKTEALIRPLLSDYWFFDRFASNRFLLCSELYHQLSIIEKRDIQYINEKYPNLGYETGIELRKVIERIDKTEGR